MKKRIAILGSTGSIGTQALQVISENPELLQVTVLTARDNVDLIIKQAKEFQPKHVVVTNTKKYPIAKKELNSSTIEIHSGEKYRH
jgi:1-deoxy-D-xylulose-5-phosphate reductoisomerase